ncbi:hypothetical protein [Tardiphaga sp.]|uniref:hypothetical protein n=1 Tax=Tardiphaga sp. TaxID=1926292 RepID=UPI002621E610|nr:hypothetical protein [Tardiphaga sp.]
MPTMLVAKIAIKCAIWLGAADIDAVNVNTRLVLDPAQTWHHGCSLPDSSGWRPISELRRCFAGCCRKTLLPSTKRSASSRNAAANSGFRTADFNRASDWKNEAFP